MPCCIWQILFLVFLVLAVILPYRRLHGNRSTLSPNCFPSCQVRQCLLFFYFFLNSPSFSLLSWFIPIITEKMWNTEGYSATVRKIEYTFYEGQIYNGFGISYFLYAPSRIFPDNIVCRRKTVQVILLAF